MDVTSMTIKSLDFYLLIKLLPLCHICNNFEFTGWVYVQHSQHELSYCKYKIYNMITHNVNVNSKLLQI